MLSKISNSVSFFTIKDSYGATQLVATRASEESSAALDALAEVPVESVILVQGRVRPRPKAAQRKLVCPMPNYAGLIGILTGLLMMFFRIRAYYNRNPRER